MDYELGKRTMKRAVELCPELTIGKGIEALDVVRHTVGFRPVRQNGTRLESEKIMSNWVVHNYGHGGYGCKLSVLFRYSTNCEPRRSMLVWKFPRSCCYYRKNTY